MQLGASDSTKKLVSGVVGSGEKCTSLINFSHVVINYARVGVRH